MRPPSIGARSPAICVPSVSPSCPIWSVRSRAPWPRLWGSYRLCYAEFPFAIRDGELDLGFARVRSGALAKNLAGCTHVVVFAATVGLGLDRLIAKYSRLSPTRALALQALGAERVEALCDAFETDLCLASFGGRIHARFSPGYGDLPLDFQREIFRLLDPPRRIGLTLNESLLMSPTKSVTAIIGIE